MLESDTPDRYGFSLICWFKEFNFTDKFDFSPETVNSNLNIYAGCANYRDIQQ